MSFENCQLCNKTPFKYTCPRCNIIYCSLSCYKSAEHIKCSEEFYKQCVRDELSSRTKSSNNNDMRKIYEILKRIRETDAGIEDSRFHHSDGLDSDDDQNESTLDANENFSEINTGEIDEDIAHRLKDIDINDADQVWQRLTSSEREEFRNLVSSGGIMKLIPDFKPWWSRTESPRIIVLNDEVNHKQEKDDVPKVVEKIAKYFSLCSKEPASCVHYNLWNILAAYSCAVRYFNGDHLTSPNEATAYLINLCSTLKYGTNFEDVDDAITSVEMEAITTGIGVTQLMPVSGIPNSLLIADRQQLKNDSRRLMATVHRKLSALSDILRLLKLTKMTFKNTKSAKLDFQKLFALSSGMQELTCTKLQQLMKKIKFFLSYVDRENDISQ